MLSRIQLFSIPDPGSASKNLSILTPKKPKKLFPSSRKYDPGCSSRIPDPDADFLPIPDPGSRGQKGTRSRIRIRNTASNVGNTRSRSHINSRREGSNKRDSSNSRFEAGKIHYEGQWKGWSLEIETFFDLEMATSEASAIWASKSRDFQGPPLLMPRVIDSPASKLLSTNSI